jgi:hypothetical protein
VNLLRKHLGFIQVNSRAFKAKCAFWCFAATLEAHVVSISTGELRMDGPTASFTLSVPMYEIAQIAHPETELLAHFRFGDGHLTRSSCQQEDSSYVCRGEYEFPGLHPDSIEVQCTLYQVTVPNHVHLLTATQGANTDQEVFDQRFTEAEVRFRPPSRAEAIAREAASGAMRAVESASGLLFLAALALAARSGKEALLFCDAFLSAEFCARWLGPLLPLGLSARFLEALLGLTVAYLAVEILLLPQGRSRWLVVAILGLCHGLSFAGFPASYLLGALPAQGAIFAILAVAAIRMPLSWKRPAAALLLAAGLAWFGVHM